MEALEGNAAGAEGADCKGKKRARWRRGEEGAERG